MVQTQLLELLRRQLDQRFMKERRLPMESPREGWVCTLRNAIGMTATQLAKLLGVSKQAIHNFEKAEIDGSITIKTLRKIGSQLDCHLKVVLVPKESLRQMIKKRAYKVATNIVERSSLHMELEAQGTNKSFKENEIKKIAEDLIQTPNKKLWEDA